MATTLMELRADKDKLDAEITSITTAIEKKEAEWMKEKKGGKDKDIIDFLRESITALNARWTDLNTQRKELQHAINNQSNQGKFNILSPYRYVTTEHIVIPNLRPAVVECSSKCVLSVELALFEGPSERLLSERVVLRNLSFPKVCLLG
jgi:hypothetical protein